MIFGIFIPTVSVNEAKIKNIKPNSITMSVGERAKIRTKIKKKIKWRSNNKKIVTVSKKGILKAKKPGKAKISAYVGKQKTVYNVTVLKNTDNTISVLGQDVIFSQPTPAPTDTPGALNTPKPADTPTPTPYSGEDVSDIWLFFDINESEIKPETTLLTGSVDNKNYETAIKVKVNGTLTAEKQLLNGEDTFSLEVDFSNYKPGDEVIISREYTGNLPVHPNVRILNHAKRFLIIKDYPIVADAWLYFDVDQEYITPETTFITGGVIMPSYETAIRVKVNDAIIAEQKLLNGEETFSLNTDFSGYQTGDEVVISREYIGTNTNPSLAIWNQHKTFLITEP